MHERRVSAKLVIAKIFRDFRPNTNTFVHDAYEWIGEGLQFIGNGGVIEEKSTTLKVEDYISVLPANLLTVSSVHYGGVGTLSDSDKLSLTPSPLTHERYEILPSQGRLNSARQNQLMSGTSSIPSEQYYVQKGNVLQFPFDEGIIVLTYFGFAVDESGMPMIPDNISLITALTWYILSKMILGGYKHPSTDIDYNFAHDKWLTYCSQARNALVYPSVGDMEAFLRGWVKLMPEDRFVDGFELDSHSTPQGTYGEPYYP